ncbi:hypothetical protein [Streptomyces sp. M92]|uniref:hypothetical protein n=1 Tax=Streptomyces sp. M92 TaxID=2944250 RepID=UPI00234A2C56|nr:hypothetical protein [Streptomyces sp. M92]WCN07324.1 hypothetical protein M6G08_12295 [Streptomyces sp. M92]
MIWSAVLPEVAWRMMRTAAGRRALHVALLVGGLFVLGVLCGERAEAAEGVPSPRGVTGQVVDVSQQRPSEEPAAREPVVPEGLRSSQDSPTGRAHEVAVPGLGLRHVTEDVVRPVEDRVVRPVVDVVQTVADGIGAAAQAEAPPLESLTAAPGLTAASGLTAAPGLTAPPGLTDLTIPPGLTDLPGRVVPADPLPRPLPSITQPAASHTVGAEEDAADQAAAASDPRSTEGTAGPSAAASGPRPGTSAAPSAAHAATDRTVAASPATTQSPAPAPAPARQSPTGDPDGTLGAGAGADHGTPRHGDAHAVTPHHRVPIRLLPGALASADAAGTWDRHRDIPVSPA